MSPTRLALVAIGIGWASSVFAAELPSLGTVVGTEDPLAIFPQSLPEHASANLEFDGRERLAQRLKSRDNIKQGCETSQFDNSIAFSK